MQKKKQTECNAEQSIGLDTEAIVFLKITLQTDRPKILQMAISW